MKLNSKILVTLLFCVVAAVTIGIVAAEDVTLPDGATYVVPDGFEVQTDDDGNTALVKDNLDHYLFFSFFIKHYLAAVE